MANNKIGSKSSSKSEGKSDGNDADEKTAAVALNRYQTKLDKGTADKLKTWAMKLLASSKSNISRDDETDQHI
ncbi:hypothetical protein DAPPUDRAFT_242661 [Daphnia pulex]|uniref:Uncharacterized protein n=1 Tax=Daphnia pulex TaxID=6669 RepID=E9GH68_DAPPU|nr:hypothetical protein DAPPUDRAFT_242661 [Daphnia pulex]|eukprot:EFX81150.1 hypothetical protein DAPPUDRAFT_242661 [Daphnia pulex]